MTPSPLNRPGAAAPDGLTAPTSQPARRQREPNLVYYPIGGLTRDGFPVFFPIQGLRLKSGDLLPGQDVVGLKKTYRKGQPTEAKVYRVRRADLSYEDLPRHLTPTLFRPISLAKYPDPLPEPAALTADTIAWGSDHPEQNVPADDPLPLDWVGPYNQPGKITREEAEIRILRALKTELARGVDDHGLYGPSAKSGTDVLAGMADGGAITVAGWVPDKRDIGDWVIALGWLNRIDSLCAHIIRLKGRDYSFRQIAERYVKHLKRERVREKYHEGMDAVVKVANGGR